MGQSESKRTRLSTEKRQEREKLKRLTLQQRKQEIENLQETILQPNTGKQLILREAVALLKVGEVAKHQLDRGGGTLTKLDLIAIIIALEPNLQKDMEHLNQLTVSDLNSMIRSVVYDPQRVFSIKAVQNEKNNNLQIKYLS